MKTILMRAVLMLLVVVMVVVSIGGCKTTLTYERNGHWDTDLYGNKICEAGGSDCSLDKGTATFESTLGGP